jgi:hypothetical protein
VDPENALLTAVVEDAEDGLLSRENIAVKATMGGVKGADVPFDYDEITGELTVDLPRDLSATGTVRITVTARDASGNLTRVRRKITVLHDEEDTLALVKSIAAELGDDPEALRNYVRSSISYTHSWGGDDPVWYGFTYRQGNCYVHALCLKAIFDEKGINNQLIWVTDKTHYWLIVEIEPGVWRHIDPTPSNIHSTYSLMTDDMRYWTLSGRNWDRSQWPACE